MVGCIARRRRAARRRNLRLHRDLGHKRRLYAAAGIPTYWVVDAERGVTHVFDRPEDGDDRRLALVRFGDPLAVPGAAATIVAE